MEARTTTEQRRTAVLTPHPTSPPSPITTIDIDVIRTSLGVPVLEIQWRMTGDLEKVVLPAPSVGRTDGLWQSTCVEAFVKLEGQTSYREINVSPTDGWAAYSFTDYRLDMTPSVEPIAVERWTEGAALTVAADFDLDALFPEEHRGRAIRLALSAVIETVDGGMSYWALAHPSDKPDFHHPDSFVLDLP